MAELTADAIRGVLDHVERIWVLAGLVIALTAQVVLLNDLFKRSGVDAPPGLEAVYMALVVGPIIPISIRLGLDTVELLRDIKSQPTEA